MDGVDLEVSGASTTVITALIGAVATILAAIVTARAKDRTVSALERELTRIRQGQANPIMLTPTEYGIEITDPPDYSPTGHAFVVRGTYEQLPEGHAIWLAAFAVDQDEKGRRRTLYWPQTAATTAQLLQRRTWQARMNYLDGRDGAVLEYLVLVVGPNGQALFAHYDNVGWQHRVWPAIARLTDDIVECAIGKVRLVAQESEATT
jgi:hypothetical protein